MEVWVRSQDRRLLIKCNSIHIENKYDKHVNIFDNKSPKPEVIGYNLYVNGGMFVGEYSSKEKAFEVLDEIQGKLLRGNPSEVKMYYILSEEK